METYIITLLLLSAHRDDVGCCRDYDDDDDDGIHVNRDRGHYNTQTSRELE